MVEHKVVKLDATPKNRPARAKEILEKLESDGWEFRDTIMNGGHSVAMVLIRDK